MKQIEAFKILKSGVNVFLTGEPGSGKTYVVNQYVAYLNSHKIKPAVTASTGIAATHIGGMTIHSWSGIGIKNKLNSRELNNIATNDYVKKRVAGAKVLIIDEVSMLPPSTLQMIDMICREVKKSSQPFGGLQLILVGDFFQLPPVVKRNFDEFSQENLFDEEPARFAYDSPVWEESEFTTCYITEQHRQDDSALVSILSKIRSNSFDDISLESIKERKANPLEVPDSIPKLYSHNMDVDAMNDRMLAKIPGEVQHFPMITKGHEALVSVMKKGCLSPDRLFLKIGASVMFTKNNAKEGFANGTLGVVESFSEKTEMPIVKTRDGRKIEVAYAEWIVEEEGKIKGRLSQIPLRLAWAITVHKSQGISLDEAVIDLSRVFEFGQGYVAISRVKRLSGVYLLGWNEIAFQVDPEVLKQDKEFRTNSDQSEKIFSSFTEQELDKMNKEFIVKCEGAINPTKVTAKKTGVKSTTSEETLRLWNEKKDIVQIAKIRNLSEKTILSHIEELVSGGSIKPKEISNILSIRLKKDSEDICKVFKEQKTDKLSPVFLHFHGRYSYDELRLVRMTIKP